MKATKLIVLCVLAANGCGSNEDERTPGIVDNARAKASSQALARGVRRATRDGDGPGGVAEIVASAVLSQAVVRWGTPAQPTALTPAARMTPTSSCLCTTTGCAYVDCTPAGTTGVKVNGSYAWDGRRFTCDALRYELTVEATKTLVTIDCDVVVTETSVTGTVRVAGSSSLGRLVQSDNVEIGDVAWTANTRLESVTFEARELTGGTARVDATSTMGEITYEGSAEISFP